MTNIWIGETATSVENNTRLWQIKLYAFLKQNNTR